MVGQAGEPRSFMHQQDSRRGESVTLGWSGEAGGHRGLREDLYQGRHRNGRIHEKHDFLGVMVLDPENRTRASVAKKDGTRPVLCSSSCPKLSALRPGRPVERRSCKELLHAVWSSSQGRRSHLQDSLRKE
jgi:hypothetical protein